LPSQCAATGPILLGAPRSSKFSRSEIMDPHRGSSLFGPAAPLPRRRFQPGNILGRWRFCRKKATPGLHVSLDCSPTLSCCIAPSSRKRRIISVNPRGPQREVTRGAKSLSGQLPAASFGTAVASTDGQNAVPHQSLPFRSGAVPKDLSELGRQHGGGRCTA
jgi:hypothetical protein